MAWMMLCIADVSHKADITVLYPYILSVCVCVCVLGLGDENSYQNKFYLIYHDTQ